MSPNHEPPPPESPAAPPPGATPEPSESVGTLVKQFALYPFFIVLGVVAVFTLFSLLLRDRKTEMDYLREIRTARGDKRWYAAFELSRTIAQSSERLKSDRAFVDEVTAVFETAGAQDPKVQRYLAIVLGQVGGAGAQPALAAALQQSADAETRMYAALALGKIGGAAAVPPLVAALEDTASNVRASAAYALGYLHDGRTVDALRARLADANENVRWNAAIALAQNGSGAGFGVLQQMVNSLYLSRIPGMTDERMKDVMLNAVKALGVLQTTDPSARDLLEETRRTAPYPLVQHEAEQQLARVPAASG